MADKSVAVKISFEVAKAQDGLKKLAAETQKATDEVKKMDEGVKKSNSTFLSQAGAVFTGIASYEALKKVLSGVGSFLISSAEASMKSAEAMARVNTNITNAGLSIDQIIPKLKQYSDKMIQMGFDDEDTAESVSRLALVTKDYDQALKLNALAMDLARNKNIDLATATGLVTQVTQGNGRVLKQYGIELDETATAADNLASLHDKVKGSADAFGDTIPGKLAAVKVQWENMKEQVGDKLMPVLEQLFNSFQKAMPMILAAVETLGKALGWVGKQIEGANAAFEILSGTLEQSSKQAVEVGDGIRGLLAEWNKLHPKAQLTEEDWKRMDWPQQKQYIDSVKKSMNEMGLTLGDAGKTAKATESDFSSIGVASKSNAQEIDKQKQALQAMGDVVKDMQSKSKNFSIDSEADFGKLTSVLSSTKGSISDFVEAGKRGFDAFKGKIGDLNGEIKNLEGQLQKAKDSFADFLSSTKDQAAGDFANIILSAEQAVPKLQEQLAKAQAGGDSEQAAEIQAQLAEKQAILLSAQQEEYTSNEALQTELGFLRENANRNELEAASATIQRKIDARTEEFNKEVEFLNAQILKKTEERDNYILAQQAMTNAFAVNAAIRGKTAIGEANNMKALTASVNEAIAAYQRLAAMRAGAGGGGVKAFAEGGVVTSPTLALVGERGPERIEPIGRGSSSGGVTVNFNNPSVRNDSDLAALVGVVESVLNRKQELAQFGSYK